MSISRLDGNYPDSYLLYWLSLFFGEDTREPYPTRDVRFNWLRGSLYIDEAVFHNYIEKVERLPPKSYPKWKQELLERALSYYVIAVSTGINMMPLNLGLFGLSVECLTNLRYGNSRKNGYITLGKERYSTLINKRLEKYKKNPKYKDQARKASKQLLSEFKLLVTFRNAYYGHSTSHQRETKQDITKQLRSLYLHQGYKKKYVERTFQTHRIHEDIATEAHNLYKFGLKLNRLFFFYHLGIMKDVPFADQDLEF